MKVNLYMSVMNISTNLFLDRRKALLFPVAGARIQLYRNMTIIQYGSYRRLKRIECSLSLVADLLLSMLGLRLAGMK